MATLSYIHDDIIIDLIVGLKNLEENAVGLYYQHHYMM